MPGWPRLIIVAVAIGIASVDGIEPSKGAFDYIGGSLVLLALLWPGMLFEFTTGAGEGVFLKPRRIGWPSPYEVAERASQRDNSMYSGYRPYGVSIAVSRYWRWPFLFTWVGMRFYSVPLEGVRLRGGKGLSRWPRPPRQRA